MIGVNSKLLKQKAELIAKCNQWIQMQESMPDCIWMTDGYHSRHRTFFFCFCDPDCQEPICEACLLKCHVSHWTDHTKEEIPSDYRNAICHCGQQNHNLQSSTTQKDYSYNVNCLFMEWSLTSGTYTYYYHPQLKTKYCLFCYNLCKKQSPEYKPIIDEKNIEAMNCNCKHDNYNSIFDKFGKWFRNSNFAFEKFKQVQFINMVFLSNTSFNNSFHNINEIIDLLGVEIEDTNFTFDSYGNNSVFLKAIDKIECMVNTMKSMYYIVEKWELSHYIFLLLEKKFSYKSEMNTWMLKKNLFNIYYKINFKKEFEILPCLSYRDFLNFSPFQRLMYSDYIREFNKFDVYLNINLPNKNYVNVLLRVIEKYKNIKSKNEYAYEILKTTYSQCKCIIRFNRFTQEQIMKFFSLNDELIYSSINSKDSELKTGLSQMRMWSQMSKCVLYLAYYYNDKVLKSYLNNEIEISRVSLIHSSNETAKMIYRNCANIWLYCRTIFTECFSCKNNGINMNTIIQSSLHNLRDSKIPKYHNRIMFIATEIAALTLNYPDAYLFGWRRGIHKGKEIEMNYINKNFTLKEHELLEEFKKTTVEIEKLYWDNALFLKTTNDIRQYIIAAVDKLWGWMKTNNYESKEKQFQNNLKKSPKGNEGSNDNNNNNNNNNNKESLPSNTGGAGINEEKGNKGSSFLKFPKQAKDDKNQDNSSNFLINNNNSSFSKSNNAFDKSIKDSHCRWLINKTPLVYSIVKSLEAIFTKVSVDKPSKSSDEYLSNLFRFLYYYITDTPGNCWIILTESLWNSFLLIPNDQIYRFIGWMEYIVTILKKNEINIAQINHWWKVIETIAIRINDKKEYIHQFDQLLTIIKILTKWTYLHQEHTLNKMRKMVKKIYYSNKVLPGFKSKLVRKNESDLTWAQMIEQNETFQNIEMEWLLMIFTKLLKIINYLFDGTATLNECQFLSTVFIKDEIPFILGDLTLFLPLRLEILKFFRIVYIDIIIDPMKWTKYYKIFSSDVVATNEGNSHFACFQDWWKIKNKSWNVTTETQVLLFELVNFSKIIEWSKSQDKKIFFRYFERGIVCPLQVFLNQYISIIYNLKGQDFKDWYEIVLHFLELKRYWSDSNNLSKNTEEYKDNKKAPEWFNTFPQSKDTELNLIESKLSMTNIKKLDEDIQLMKSSDFNIENYKMIYVIFEENINGFILKPKSTYLKELFSKKDKIYSDEDVISKEREYKKIGMWKTVYESRIWEFIWKYENDKTKFLSSSWSKNLNEKNIISDSSFRSIMLRPMFYLINKENLYIKYRRQNLWHIFRLLQYDTGGTQEDILLLLRNDKNLNRPTVNWIYLSNIFLQNLLSLIFSSCNPDVSSTNEDYTIAYMVIKIMKYMCEDHNTEFQTIFFSEVILTIGPGEKDKINMFDFMMCALGKIAILGRWDKVKFGDDENSISYFYEIFFAMIEFSIEMIQGTSSKNWQRIIKGKEMEKTYFYKFLTIVRGIVTNNTNNSEIVYHVRLDIVNFIVAFWEEKNSPQKLINIIATVYNPWTIFDSIVNTLKKWFAKYAKDHHITWKNEEFDNKKCRFFIEKYFSDSGFSQCQEFELANRMYNYVKLLATSNNKDAKIIIDSIQIYNEYEWMELVNKKKKKSIDKDNENVLIDSKYCENYFTVKFFEEITRTVWIQGEEPEPHMVLFTKDSTVLFLSDDTKASFYTNVQRDSRSSKLFSLMEYCNYFFIEINHNKKRLSGNVLLKILNKVNYRLVEAFLFLITAVINIIIFWTIKNEDAKQDYEGLFKTLLPWVIIQIIWNTNFWLFWIISKFSWYFVIEKEKYYLRTRKDKSIPLTAYEYWTIGWIKTWFSKKEIISFLWNIVFSIIGITHSKNIFVFCIQLLILVNLSETLENLVSAITMRYKQLLTTFMFLFVVIYIFSCLAFFFFSRDFIHILQDNQENTCGSLLYCFLTHMNYGLRTDGGIGEWIYQSSFILEPSYFMGMFFFQFMFYVIIIVIMLAVIGGSVIDTFAELREKAQGDMHDMMNVCYICNGERNEIERGGENFEEHVTNVHNMWTYVDYMIGLKFVDPQETNAINSFVIEKIEEKKISWFPSFSVVKE